MQKFNIKHEKVESVFDYGITADECKQLSIPDEDCYSDFNDESDDMKRLHLALLFKLRGDVIKSLELVGNLPDKLKYEYMTLITKA